MIKYKCLQDLPYGSVIEYRKKRYFKCQGLDGDILMSQKQKGLWHFIFGSCQSERNSVDWKFFKTLFVPQ